MAGEATDVRVGVCFCGVIISVLAYHHLPSFFLTHETKHDVEYSVRTMDMEIDS
jgi:hypothetical protein